MSITTQGFGQGAITSHGWGGAPSGEEVPSPDYDAAYTANTCVPEREWDEEALNYRDKSAINLRSLPDSITERTITQLDSREKSTVPKRSRGWAYETEPCIEEEE